MLYISFSKLNKNMPGIITISFSKLNTNMPGIITMCVVCAEAGGLMRTLSQFSIIIPLH
jgi:hypothetical protein